MRASPLLIAASGRPVAPGADWECELRVGEEVFRVRAGAQGLSVQAGGADRPDAVVRLGEAALLALVTGQASTAEIGRLAGVEGDRAAADGMLKALAGTR